MLSVENWAEIRRLYRSEGLPIREIARVMGVSAGREMRIAMGARPLARVTSG